MTDNPPLHGRKFGLMLCDALGLDPNNISEIVIHSRVNEPARAEVWSFVRDDAGRRIADQIVEQYEIRDKP